MTTRLLTLAETRGWFFLAACLFAAFVCWSASVIVAGRPADSWLLVVAVDDADGFQVWPGATDWLLGRPEQSFASEAACATARQQLLRRVDEIASGAALAPRILPDGSARIDTSDVAVAACLPVVDRRRRR